ncbi:MAG: transporter substrate-binding domain-containing protein, partial [Lachnospiraceae bacterium]|nr:transporter substrate-binding domain-containing protein [Lachnospiraceae bacterium]
MKLRADRLWIKRITAGLLFIALLFALRGRTDAYASARKSITTKEDLNHEWIRIGVGEGGAAEQIAEKELPKAKRMYMNHTDGFQSVAQGKIDAYIYEREQMQQAIDNGRSGVRLLDENMDEPVHVAVGISNASQIDDLEGKMNAFIEEKKADGTLDDMYDRWVVRDDETFPDIDLPKNPSNHLTVGTTGIIGPFSYYKDSKLNGYDIELAYRFASWMDADLEFKVYDYSGVVAAALCGDVDCIMAELNVTPERAESLNFSEDLFELPVGIMVRDETAAVPEYQTFEELGGKNFSMLTGAPFEELVRSVVPDAGSFSFYNTISDMLLALKSGKTDAVLCNNAVSQLAVNRNPDLALFPEDLKDGVFGFAFAKGNPECAKWQAAFDSIPEETVNRAWSKWTGTDESKKVLPEQDWPGKNGTLRVAACDTVEPMSYIGKNGELIGFDIEMILMMAKELDVHVEFIPLEFSAVLSYIQSGKADMGNGSIIITDERKEAMDFVEYFPAAFVLIVRADDDADGYAGFLESIKEGFEKNFIREDRWKLFLLGILTTLVITVMSVVFGTALGFTVFLICKDGNPVANTVTKVSIRLIQGM